ncbi:MAG: NAD(P)H-hydrate dehydratase [Cytophagaceae bacterium]
MLLNATQIKAHDVVTIMEQNISSWDLMERASHALTEKILSLYSTRQEYWIFCGSGNNGGDGLAIARMLHEKGVRVQTLLIKPYDLSDDCVQNLVRLQSMMAVPEIHFLKEMPEIPHGVVLIDAMFGVGLNRPVEGLHSDVIRLMNKSENDIVSIDVPSGMYIDKESDSKFIVKATHTLTIQYLKKGLMMASNAEYMGEVHVLDIGLSESFYATVETNQFLLDEKLAKSLVKSRSRFGHKGTFGKALLMVGSAQYPGAALLTTKACLRSGVGYVKAHIPSFLAGSLVAYAPEVILSRDPHVAEISEVPDFSGYHAVGIGPGIGLGNAASDTFKRLLDMIEIPLVVDASALHIISQHTDWYPLLDEGTIITPHPLEFDRLIGTTCTSDWERLEKAQQFARERKVIVVLKGAYTAVIDYQTGNIYFNTSGNSGMGTAGSGDVLTGILTGLLAQGYSPLDAARLGVYMHGYAGDEAAKCYGPAGLTAGDIADATGSFLKNGEL